MVENSYNKILEMFDNSNTIKKLQYVCHLVISDTYDKDLWLRTQKHKSKSIIKKITDSNPSYDSPMS